MKLQQETLILDKIKESYQHFTKHWDRFCEEIVARIDDPLRSYPDFFSFTLNNIFRNFNCVYFSLKMS